MPESPVFLTVNDLLRIHDRALTRHGGLRGVLDAGKLDAACEAPKAGTSEGYLYGSLARMASAYMVSIGKGHAFNDGNKRVALAATMFFLGVNGVRLEMPQVSAEEMAKEVAKCNWWHDEVVSCLEQNAQA